LLKPKTKSMKKKLSLIILSLFLAAFSEAPSQDIKKTADEGFPMVSIPRTEMRPFYSAILDREMLIHIKLPSSYYSNPEKVFPGWYFTDANRSFPLVEGIINIFDLPGSDQQGLVLIGIGYKIRDMGDWGAFRTQDLTPTNVPAQDSSWSANLSNLTGRTYEVKTGGAGKFLEFIEKELIPFVESNYRVSSANRGIGGYSYGGLFSLYVLLKKPELFNNYYAGSPSIGYDNGVLFNYEQEYAATHKDMEVKLFMSAGSLEGPWMLDNMKKMTDVLKSRNYPGLKLETRVFPDEWHQSCPPTSITLAYRFLYLGS
jgi:predicted alpha/beta superfamily hydrolase